MLSRRGLITGLISFVAAPAIVRRASIMSVKVVEEFEWSGFYSAYPVSGGPVWADLVEITRKAFVPRLYAQLYGESHMEWLPNTLRGESVSELNGE